MVRSTMWGCAEVFYMDKISLIKKVLVSFEQSSTSIKYDKLYFWNDGPNKIKQITVSFGITEWGNLKKTSKRIGILSSKDR